MARSKEVYAVLGLMCIDQAFRNDFFDEPLETSRTLVGSLTTDEQLQLKRIAGESGIAPGDKVAYVQQVKEAFDLLYAKLQCPTHPCPDPDPFTADLV